MVQVFGEHPVKMIAHIPQCEDDFSPDSLVTLDPTT